jgi:AAA15 family ATPase/GTPase
LRNKGQRLVKEISYISGIKEEKIKVMSKLNQFQKSVVRDALLMYGDALKGEIKQAIENDKTPFMTEGFVDMQINELLDTLKIVKG